MNRILFIVLILFLAVFLGLQLNHDPGYVLIAVNQWTIETTLWFAVFMLLAGFAFAHGLLLLLAHLGQVPTNYHTWKTRHKTKIAQDKTRQGLIEFSEGYWSKAKNHLIKALPNTDTPLLNYLTAARAAQELGDSQLRDNYLREAQQAMPEAQVAVELTQAQLQLANKQLEQALATLRHLQDMAPKHPYVLKLLSELYQEVKDWTSLITLLPELKKYHVLPEPVFDKLYQHVYLEALHSVLRQQQQDKINLFFNELPKSIRQDPDIISPYCRYLITADQSKQAETILTNCLRKRFDAQLITIYGLIHINPEQLQFAEGFLKTQADSPELFLCLARLSAAQQLWGKTRGYLEQSLAIKPTPAAYAELGKLHQTLNDSLDASTAYRAGLSLVLET